MAFPTRRVFFLQSTFCAAAAIAATPVPRPGAIPRLDERDPAAVALGYVNDTLKADQKKFPAHAGNQECNNCGVYQGRPDDATGPCPVFPGKVVAAAGWCASWVNKD